MSKLSKKRTNGSDRVIRPWRFKGGGRRKVGEETYDTSLLLRMYREEKDVIVAAASESNKSISGFIRDSATREARRVLRRQSEAEKG